MAQRLLHAYAPSLTGVDLDNMEDNKYRIITNGRPAKGQAPDEVLKRLSTLFKSPPEKIRQLLSGKVVIVRKGLDEQTARRMLSSLRRAGLTCKVERETGQSPAGRSPTPPSNTGAPDVRAATGARSIDPDMGSTQVEHTTMASAEITPSEAGIDFHKPGSRNIPFSRILLLAVYEIPSPLGGETKLMAFLSSSKRPLVLSASSIKYWQFEGISSKSTGVSLRQFIAYVYAHNPSLALDAPTVKFLDGGLPRELDVDESILSSALGKVLAEEGLFVADKAEVAEHGADMRETFSRIKQAGLKKPSTKTISSAPIALMATGLAGAWGLWNLWGQLSFLRYYGSYLGNSGNFIVNHLLMWTSVILLVLLVTYAGVVFRLILGKSPDAKGSFRLLAWMMEAFSVIRFALLWGLATGLRRGIISGEYALADLTGVLGSKNLVLSALVLSPAGIAIPLMILAVFLYSRPAGAKGRQKA